MKKLFILATAAVALASCSDSDLVGNIASSQQTEQPQAVEFGTYMGSAATRTGTAGTITTASLKTGTHATSGFGVMGYQMTADWANNQTTDRPNFMYNQQITWNANGYWTYDPVKYWPNGIDKANAENDPSNTAVSTNGDKLNFFAYAPWVDVAAGNGYTTTTSITLPATGGTAKDAFFTKDATASDLGNGIAAIKANTVAAAPEVYYYMPTATTDVAVDLLWGLRGSMTYNETDNVDNTVTELGNSYNVNLTKQDVPETVNFLFKHALSKIGGNTKSTTSTAGTQKCGLKVVLDIDGNGNGINGVDNQSLYLGSSFENTKTLVTIKSVAVQDGTSAYAERASVTDPDKNALPDAPVLNSDLINSGWFNLATGTWNNVEKITKTGAVATSGAIYNIAATTDGTYKLDPQIAEPTAGVAAILKADKTEWVGDGTTGKPNGVIASAAKNVYSDDTDVPSLLMIPNGTTPQTLYVTVDYIVRTADPQLSNGYSQVEQIVTNKVSLTGLEVNKYYTLVMHLGLTSVKFSAIVADWANSDDASYDEGGTTDGTAEAAEEVWLPSNVIAVSTSNSSTPELGTSYNENLKASTTTYTVNLAGLAKDQKITATFAAPITAVSIDGNALTSGTAFTLTDATPAGVVAVTLTANTNVTAAKSLLTILQEANDGTDLTTTSINFVQSGYDINLTGTTGTVAVKDDENHNVAASSLTVGRF